MAIDLDSGVMLKRHTSGMYVYMYFDNPGVYLNGFGKEVPEAIAEEAGFNTKLYAKEKLKRERMAEAMSAIEMELELAKEQGTEKVLVEGGGYKVIGLGLGTANVLDEDGNQMNAQPIPVEMAKALFKKLTKPEKE